MQCIFSTGEKILIQEPFTDEIVASLSRKPGEYTDPATAGLVFSVKKRAVGTRCIWRFRIQLRGIRSTHTIAIYPETKLKEARERAAICREIYTECFDLDGPFGDIIRYRETPKTVEALWPHWVESEKERGSSHAMKPYMDTLARGKNYVFPEIGQMAPADVTTSDVAKILNAAYAKLHETTVKKLKQDITKFFSWCQVTGFIDAKLPSPAEQKALAVLICRPRRRLKSTPNPALAAKDVKRFVELLVSDKFAYRTSSMALLFTLLTASRVGNVIGSLDHELTQPTQWGDFNRELTLWTIPATNMKTGYRNGEHTVPLSTQARLVLRIIRQRQKGHTDANDFVFATHNGNRFDYRMLPELLQKLSEEDLKLGGNGFVDENTGARIHTHGFRATFKTWGTDHGIDWTLTELALHHAVDKLRYDRAKAIRRRRKVMQLWADFCFSEAATERLKELAGVSEEKDDV